MTTRTLAERIANAAETALHEYLIELGASDARAAVPSFAEASAAATKCYPLSGEPNAPRFDVP